MSSVSGFIAKKKQQQLFQAFQPFLKQSHDGVLQTEHFIPTNSPDAC